MNRITDIDLFGGERDRSFMQVFQLAKHIAAVDDLTRQ